MYSIRKLELTQPFPPSGRCTSTHSASPTRADGPVCITPVKVGWNVPTTGFPAPAPERILSTSPGKTRMTAYGPEGTPDWVVAVGRAVLPGRAVLLGRAVG